MHAPSLGFVEEAVEQGRAEVTSTPARRDVHPLHLSDSWRQNAQRTDTRCLAAALGDQQ
jgi:hypothetical protein